MPFSSKIWQMFAWVSWTPIFASSMNIVMNSSSSAMFGRMRLTATSRSKPSTPKAFRPDLGHAADVDPVEQQVLSEGDRLLLRRGDGQGRPGPRSNRGQQA